MSWLHEAAYFFGGALLTNALPHFISGVSGQPFPTPFARPPGRGLSSSTVNVLWGSLNLLLGYLLIWHVGKFNMRATGPLVALGLGIICMGLLLAHLFGRIRDGSAATKCPDRR